jgi:hypothetical protein
MGDTPTMSKNDPSFAYRQEHNERGTTPAILGIVSVGDIFNYLLYGEVLLMFAVPVTPAAECCLKLHP